MADSDRSSSKAESGGGGVGLKNYVYQPQARNQDFMWGGANEAKADPTTEMYFLSSDPFI